MTPPRRLLLLILVVTLGTTYGCTNDSPGSAGPPEQAAKLVMHPPIAQPGAEAAPAAEAERAMSATFTPARAGREVVLQRRVGTGWETVATGAQNDRGIAEFSVPNATTDDAQVYRAYTTGTQALPKATSPTVSTTEWAAPTFSDEFDGDALSKVWSHRLWGYSVESKRKCSKADPRAVDVRDGRLRLSVMEDPRRRSTCSHDGQEHAWRINGHIGTEGAESFTYGYAAARIRFQPRQGQHASFWMQPEAPAAEEGPAKLTGAEIDVVEWFGPGMRRGGLCHFIYDYPDDGTADRTARKTGRCLRDPRPYGTGWDSKFHVFSVKWTPKRYVFRIDGKETFRTAVGVSGRRQYLILSLLSSDYELANLGGEENLPQHMEVDWVRFWAS